MSAPGDAPGLKLNLKAYGNIWMRSSRTVKDKVVPLRYRVTIEQDEDGMFVAECPSLPGCVSQGASRDEALDNIKDAISGYLKSLEQHDEPIPPPIWEETVEIRT